MNAAQGSSSTALGGAVVFLAIAVFVAYKIYEFLYYRGQSFQSIKERIAGHINECNALNEHIEDLKQVDLVKSQKQYGSSDFRDSSHNLDSVLDLFMISKYFERIGDHSVNIARWVLYMITGTLEGNTN